MITWQKAVIKELIQEHDDKQLWWTEDETGARRKAVVYTKVSGSFQTGDKVWLNVTATSLSLGTGGVDFVISKTDLINEKENIHTELPLGHIMKLRYTPYQICVQSVEEQSGIGHHILMEKTSVDGMITIVGELHSMLPILTVVINHLSLSTERPCNIVYIMTDGAALPIAFSDNVRKLKEMGWINHTITAGHAFGGEAEAVNVYSALLAAKHVYGADISIVLMGPGTVGTATTFGTTSIEFGTIINAVHSLEGWAVSVPRISFADKRDRHQGISHHTITSLTKVALGPSHMTVPYLDEHHNERIQHQLDQHQIGSKHILHDNSKITSYDLQQMLSPFPGRITTMGRGIEEEEAFFLATAESAMLAWRKWIGEDEVKLLPHSINKFFYS